MALSQPTSYVHQKKKNRMVAGLRKKMKREGHVWALCIPIILYVFLFSYVPLYGIYMAFVDYAPGLPLFEAKWVGLKWIEHFVTSADFPVVMRNTLVISGLTILFGFPAPIVFALLLNEYKLSPFKKLVQTASYLPHFISWVVVAGIIHQLLGSEGLLNQLIVHLNLAQEPLKVIGNGKAFWPLIVSANIWKNVGFSSIIYLSALAGIDKELYEVASLDGIGRFRRMWHINLPGICQTVAVLFVLEMGSVLNAGFEQQLLLGNALTIEYHEVLDTFVYRMGLQLGKYSYASCIGFFKSIIGFTLVLVTNKISRKISGLTVI